MTRPSSKKNQPCPSSKIRKHTTNDDKTPHIIVRLPLPPPLQQTISLASSDTITSSDHHHGMTIKKKHKKRKPIHCSTSHSPSSLLPHHHSLPPPPPPPPLQTPPPSHFDESSTQSDDVSLDFTPKTSPHAILAIQNLDGTTDASWSETPSIQDDHRVDVTMQQSMPPSNEVDDLLDYDWKNPHASSAVVMTNLNNANNSSNSDNSLCSETPILDEMLKLAQEMQQEREEREKQRELTRQALVKMGLDPSIPIEEHIEIISNRSNLMNSQSCHSHGGLLDRDTVDKGFLLTHYHSECKKVDWEVHHSPKDIIGDDNVRFETTIICVASDNLSFKNKVPFEIYSGTYELRVKKDIEIDPFCILQVKSESQRWRTSLNSRMEQDEKVYVGYQDVTFQSSQNESCSLHLSLFHDHKNGKKEEIRCLSCCVKITPKQSLFSELLRFNIFNFSKLNIQRELKDETISWNDIQKQLQQGQHSLERYNCIESNVLYYSLPHPCTFQSLDRDMDLEDVRTSFEQLGVDVYGNGYTHNWSHENFEISCPEEVILMYQTVAAKYSRQAWFLYAKLLNMQCQMSSLNDRQREYLALFYVMLNISTFVNPQVTTILSPFDLPEEMSTTKDHQYSAKLRNKVNQRMGDYFPQCISLSADNQFFEQVFQMLSPDSIQTIMRALLTKFGYNLGPEEKEVSSDSKEISISTLIRLFPPLMINFIRSGVMNSRPLAIRSFFGKFFTILLCKVTHHFSEDLQQRICCIDVNQENDADSEMIDQIAAQALNYLSSILTIQKENISYEEIHFIRSSLTLLHQVLHFGRMLTLKKFQLTIHAFLRLKDLAVRIPSAGDSMDIMVFELTPLKVVLGIHFDLKQHEKQCSISSSMADDE
nr:unnamed protein product [Naegleria fowleri]